MVGFPVLAASYSVCLFACSMTRVCDLTPWYPNLAKLTPWYPELTVSR